MLVRQVSLISQMKHPSGYEKLAKAYAAKMKEKEYKGRPGHAINDIARQVKGIRPRQLAAYINKLVDKGIMPQELKTEYEMEETMSFRDFINHINNK